MAQQGWSSLPADLVNRIADCLLATNDLDCYKDLRAVCHRWRSSTADPVSNQHEPRFRPSRWIMLDEHMASSDIATLVFVNTATGRFLRRRLPFLHDRGCYVFVTSTTDGLLVLAGRDPPYAVSVLNPFTGSLIRFAAPLPSESQSRLEIRLTADVVGSWPTPTLVLVSVSRNWVYWAEPQSKSFSVDKSHRDCPASRLPLIAATINRESVPGAKNIFDQLRSEEDEDCRCYAVVAGGGGDMLAVLKRRRGMNVFKFDVFKIDAAGNVTEKVNSIGSQALFLGVRCLVVDTDCLPTVEANCAYLQLTDNRLLLGQRYIYKFNIGNCDDEEEPAAFVSAAMGSATVYLPNNLRPFTLTQFLSSYTMDIPCHLLAREMSSSHLELEDYVEVDCYKEYIDFFEDESDEDYGCQPYDLEDYLGYQYFSDYDDYGYQG